MEHAGKCCRYLQDNGINAFALGYFKTKHASKKLNLIPVEIFADVIVKTPSWFYSEGLAGGQPSGDCCWSLHGQALPFTPYKERKYNMFGMIWQSKEYNILPVNTGKNVLSESIIPVEKIQAPILMLSTKVDTIWPSAESCAAEREAMGNACVQWLKDVWQ